MTMNVYHLKDSNFRTEGHNFPEDYTLVAKIFGEDNLDRAFELTNHIDGYWWRNPGVMVIGELDKRSTSVGDVVEMVSSGDAYMVAPVGWEKLEHPSIKRRASMNKVLEAFDKVSEEIFFGLNFRMALYNDLVSGGTLADQLVRVMDRIRQERIT